MMCATRYFALAIAALAIGAAPIDSSAPEDQTDDGDAWEIAWNVALHEHLAGRGDKSAFLRRRDRSDAREIYGNAWKIYKRAGAIYEADWEGHVAAAWENLQFAMQIREDARMKYNAAYKAERTAKNAAAKAARAIYETGRERNIAAWENYQAALQKYEDARMKREAAYKAERAAIKAVRDAVSKASRAARKAIEEFNSGQD